MNRPMGAITPDKVMAGMMKIKDKLGGWKPVGYPIVMVGLN